MNDAMFTFPKGLPGFEDCTQFELCRGNTKNVDLFQLQSVDHQDLAFSMVDPTTFDLNYQFTLTDEEQKLLEIDNDEDVVVLLMLSRKDADSAASIHANVSGPVILNINSNKGFQKVLNKVNCSVNLTEQ